MKQILITQYGNTDVLQLVEENIPEPKPNEVRIKVRAAGVSLADVSARSGIHTGTLPVVPGSDVIGEIDKVGTAVTTLSHGQSVAALPLSGGYAEYVCVAADAVAPIPPGIDPAEAVSLVSNYLTAYQMLHRIKQVRAGESVLVHGAAGGVGTALLQLSQLAHLTVYGTASAAKHEVVRRLGAVPIDYKTEDFRTRIRELTKGVGVDAVFDPISGAHWWQSYRTLKRGGQMIGYGFMNLDNHPRFKTIRTGCSLAPLLLMKLLPDGRSATLFAIRLVSRRPDWYQWYQEDLATLFELLQQRKIEPIIAERLPLHEAAKAHQLLENRRVSGKIVLMPA